jgi:hypothetical protein
MRKTRKWIFDIKTGNRMIVHMEEESESVAACAQIKDDHKANEEDMTYTVQWSINR